MDWYAATTHMNQELTAKRELEQQGIRSFLPRYTSRRIIRRQSVTVTKPLFPGYIFPWFDIEEESWRFINSTRGIRKLMPTWSEFPTPVSNAVIQSLLDQCDDEETVTEEIVSNLIPIGSFVRIDEDPFKGLVGEVNLSDGNQVSVVVLMFGRPTSIGLKASAVTVFDKGL